MSYKFFLTILLAISLSGICSGQATEFTYQGQLQNSSLPASGNFDFEFDLFDAVSGGSLVGSTQSRSNVGVSNGIFSVNLDFGNSFPGAQRFLEIRVRQAGGGAFTTLSPRQSVSSSPYSVRSLNADTANNASQLGGLAANQYVVTTDPRMTDARTPLAGSSNYIQNQNAGPQSSSSFNISGNGTAAGTLSGGTVNAANQYNLGGERVFASFFGSTFLGVGAGFTGSSNAFFGFQAGQSNLIQGGSNSFFGHSAGRSNTNGSDNSIFGSDAGDSNTTGTQNSFFGRSSGISNTEGFQNSFFGRSAGLFSTTGNGNTFVGANSGFGNTTGSNNTLLGSNTNVAPTVSFGTAIGAGAVVSQNNSVVLGRALDTVRIPGSLDVTGSITGGFTVPAANISGVLAATNGGTGLASPGASGNFLRSNGSSWTTGTIAAADIPTGSPNYIQNQSVPVQTSATFNIGGTGTANTFNVVTQYNIGGARLIGASATSTFVGVGSGSSNTGNGNTFVGRSAGTDNNTGDSNSFFGNGSGENNLSGSRNSFFGASSGQNNTTATDNSFFGEQSGQLNSTGSFNSFFGKDAGRSNTSGSQNAFFGNNAGMVNTAGQSNAFFGASAGMANVSSNNAFFGAAAGFSNTTGDRNAFFGDDAGRANTIGSVNAFFGAGAGAFNTSGTANTFSGWSAGLSNTSGSANAFYGLESGRSNTTGGSNAFFGYAAGFDNTTAINNTFVGHNTGSSTTSGGNNTFVGKGAGTVNTNGTNNTMLGYNAELGSASLDFATAIGAGSVVETSNTIVVGRASDIMRVPGFIRVLQLGGAGPTPLCHNANFTISTCSSSLRYKDNINRFGLGLSLIKQLKPITFDWKDGGLHDLGLGAEDVAAIEPLLVTYNTKGEVEGVKYDRIGVVLVNAVKEQQKQIERQDATIQRQRSELAALKAFVCSKRAKTAFCKK